MTGTASTPSPLLEIDDLAVEYRTGRHAYLRAVDGVSFSVGKKETVALVGESGSGKSTISRAILGLTPVAEGRVRFGGQDIAGASYKQRRGLSSSLQVVFQDPYSSLNPARTIGQTLSETLRPQRQIGRAEVSRRVSTMLGRVGLPPDADRRYPAQFSGGQRQRIAIARALMALPELVICDEAVSALDLSVQAQILNLLRQLQDELELSYLFISHDLAVVRHVSHRVIVLYRGRVMEGGDAGTVYGQPAHPYTRALLAAAPLPDPEAQRARHGTAAVRNSDEAAAWAPDSCPYAARCPHRVEICKDARPPLETTPGGSVVACHRWRELARPDGPSQLPLAT